MTSFFCRVRRAFGVIAVALAISILGTAGVSAHEQRTVGVDYSFVVGFINEPAISGDSNGIFLEVTMGNAPVEGLGDTLTAQIIVGDQSKDIALTPVFDTPGAYEAVFIPTAPGDYTFHFTGMIGDVAIDETFTSSPEGFDSVADRTEYEFPVAAHGSISNRDLAMPMVVGAVVLVGGWLVLVRRRSIVPA